MLGCQVIELVVNEVDKYTYVRITDECKATFSKNGHFTGK